MKILIAYDGSKYANAALDDLQRAGLPCEAEAVVLCVAELWLPPLSSYEMIAGVEAPAPMERSEEALALAQRAVDRMQTVFPAWRIQSEAHRGSPAGEILRKAEAWNPDLIVVGSHGLSAIERLLLGSVSQKVIHHAPCSVRVARGSVKEKGTPVRLVIGFDGSEDAQAAVREIASRAWPANTEVRIVTAVGPLHPVKGARADLERPHARVVQQEAEARLSRAGLSVSSIIEEIDPRHVIVNEAETWKADAIFVGTSGLGRLGRLILGSVSSAVAARAHCSVEVVRPREEV